MSRVIKSALVGALAFAGIAAAAPSASAMQVSGLAPVISGDAGTASGIDKAYWRRPFGWHRHYGWHGGYGWHRPFGWHRAYGWRRPFGWHRAYGWRRPFGWHHRWHRW